MAVVDESTCSICGKKAPYLEMCSNAKFEEQRCRDCMKRYGDLPLETLRAALARFGMDIIAVPREDLDELVVFQREKISLNRETDTKILDIQKAKWIIGRERKLTAVREHAERERARINQEIDTYIQEMKEREEAERKLSGT